MTGEATRKSAVLSVPRSASPWPAPADASAAVAAAGLPMLGSEGATVHIAAFSVCMQSVLKHLPADTLITEFHAACEVLGVPQRQRHMRDFHVRTFDRGSPSARA